MDEKEFIIFIRVIILSIFSLLIFGAFMFSKIRQSKQHFLAKLNTEIKSRDEKRLKVASKLHDDIGPLLASIKMYLNKLNTQDHRI